LEVLNNVPGPSNYVGSGRTMCGAIETMFLALFDQEYGLSRRKKLFEAGIVSRPGLLLAIL
jgi:hypothetical protein